MSGSGHIACPQGKELDGDALFSTYCSPEGEAGLVGLEHQDVTLVDAHPTKRFEAGAKKAATQPPRRCV
jgi:hypothetical protein